MTKITGPDFLFTVEKAVEQNEISFEDRKVLIGDMSDILNKINKNRAITDMSISMSIWTRRDWLYLKTTTYRRIYDNHRHLVAEETAKQPEYSSYIYNDEPSVVRYHCNGNLSTHQWWGRNGMHRDDDKPASITWYENGNLKAEEWYEDDEKSRTNKKPAVINYYENGKVRSEQWWVHGNLLSPDVGLPAIIEYDINGNET